MGRILKVWDKGFILVDAHSRPIYFFERMPLHVPFGVALECGRDELVALGSLCQGCRLRKRGNILWLDNAGGVGINLESGVQVDLRHKNQGKPLPTQHGPAIMKTLSRVVASCGDSRGLAGVMTCLQSFHPQVTAGLYVPVSPYARYAMGSINALLAASPEDLPETFLRACLNLIGCGPGLTPSGDDFLTGFLAAHFLSNSSLARQIWQQKMGPNVVALARTRTTLVSAELLACAVQGRFSEILYKAWRALPNLHTDCKQNGPVHYLLNWGSSSGTDTIVGLIIGLATLTDVALPSSFDKSTSR